MLRSLLVRASDSAWLADQVTSRRLSRQQATRFIAGDTLDAGLDVAERLAASGRLVTLDHVGEHVGDESGARLAAKTYLRVIEEIEARRFPAGLSVKPTQLGLHVSRALCEELLAEVAAVKHRAADAQRAREDFEFQTLYGIRPEMQEALVNDGYRLRVYVPFGSEWFAYFMHRLGERPANLLFFLRALRGERAAASL